MFHQDNYYFQVEIQMKLKVLIIEFIIICELSYGYFATGNLLNRASKIDKEAAYHV